ncbi:AfsR/SARP family transcriptional regulator [Saccharopolyspora erythraea]|uniref:BTAD domain-containing putative transcriptional regulator n=1 Tax=Saccharopolyspora erythraea TaxID=1836 RepID=UPI001BAB38D9|nr:BTAD domain-containing putative transcriptional regulator [Saccharopolyspora erythraea]QUH04020.1 AfsR/SARP family transcriptional regulator [Saccharopolyspora erythraea]
MPEPETRSVKYFVLGPLQVRTADDTMVAVNAEKPRLLLTALLLRRNSWVDTDVLVEALWSTGTPPASARGNLKTYVHQLRQLVTGAGQESPISSRRGSYQLAVNRGEVDSDVFEDLITRGRVALDEGDNAAAEQALRTALDLWRGDPDRLAPSQETAIEAARLRELRWIARDALADALIADGRPEDAVATLRALTVEEPLREATWARLVTALRDAGRPTDALAAYQKIRNDLVAEFGAEPGRTLRALHAELLAETEGAPTPRPQRVTTDPTATRTPADSTAPSTLVTAVPAPKRRAPARWLAGRPIAVRAVVVASVLALLAVGGTVLVNRSTALTPDSPGEPAANLQLGAIAPKRPVPGFPAGTSDNPQLLFGLGDEAPIAAQQPLADQAPVGMLTTWYDGPDELPQYASWRRQLIPEYYAAGKAMHLLVVPTFDDPAPVDTKYGPGCGKAYPLSPEFLDHMRELAKSFAGKADGPPLYVSMFNGMLKVACTEDGYHADPLTTNYYRALKDRYLEVRQVFHQHAPNARVALNWDGWQASRDNPKLGSGRSLIGYFSDALAVSDFQSFNAFEDEDNAADVERMVAELGKYGPVMVSNFGPYKDHTGARLRSDLSLVFAPAQIAKLTSQGLFAWSFWKHRYVEVSPESYALAKDVVTRYGRR